MRRATIIVAFFMISTILFMPSGLSEPQTDGTAQVISSSESWNTNSELNGDVTVSDGATLTINSEITIATGTSIVVDSGANLVLNGALLAQETTSGVFMEVYNSTVVKPNFTGLVDSGTLRINMAKEYFTTMNVNITVGSTTIAWTGEEYIDYNLQFDGLPVNVSFSGFWQFPVWIESIQAFDSNGAIYTLQANEWEHNNGVLKSEEAEASYSIIINGNFESQQASMEWANLTCNGICSIENSTLSWSSPISVSENGTLSAKSSTINGSRTYEDIIVYDNAIINYDVETMVGTGGPTDMWVRLLSQRIISTNLKDAPAIAHFEGLGYQGITGDLTLDSEGKVDLGYNNNPILSKYLRMPEWLDGDGMHHQENATVLITLGGKANVWNGNSSVKLDPAPTIPYFTTSIPLPYVVVDSVIPEDQMGTANRGLGIMISVSNTGLVEVSTNIQCYEGDDLADVTTMFVSLQPGETKELPSTWYANSSGAKTLNCKALVPTMFNSLSEDLSQSIGTESEPVSFKDLDDSEDTSLILYSVIIIVMIVVAVLFSRISANKLMQVEEEEEEEEV
ncbi:MAG: hypothetical protein DWB99_00845 [Candidatus Poseidoniales archaeon]|nr:MAG: hypothetical protein DWB99_00845 [Candidatus Poseidoniales archaeon]